MYCTLLETIIPPHPGYHQNIIVTSESTHNSNATISSEKEPERCDPPQNSTASNDEGGFKIRK